MEILKRFFSYINAVIPKKPIIIFNSFPAYSDNAKSLYEYIILKRKDICKKYRLIWAQDDDNFPEAFTLKKENRFVVKKSLKGVWCFLRAQYIFTTHGYFSNVIDGKGQTQINLWHGCGYKDVSDSERNYLGKYTIITGEIYRDIHAKIFRVERNNVVVTGLPRNDELFNSGNELELLKIDKKCYKCIFIWLPTYRKAAFRHEGIDGKYEGFGLKEIVENRLPELNYILEKNNVLLLIKPHPMDVICNTEVVDTSNIKFITTNNLKNVKVDLYKLLGATDALISDYSSVIIDYLLLDKPVVILSGDKDEYSKGRGFVFKQIDAFLPGPIIPSFSALLSYFDDYENINEQWKQKRKELTDTFHKYKDNRSCERVVCEFLDS